MGRTALTRHLRYLLAAVLLVHSCFAWAQFQASGSFTSSSLDPGWTLFGGATLTAAPPTPIDPSGNGWLRLTNLSNSAVGTALYTGGSFSGSTTINISFSYVSWGGTGADGISVFLYDATQNMAGAAAGGGLGFCKGAGAYLGIALDEWGNFSNSADRCTGGGGPGRVPETLSIRGPTTSSNPFITNTLVPGSIDNPGLTTRPGLNQVVISLVPKVGTVGYTISVSFRNGATAPLTPLLTNVNFPYAAPAALSVGITGSTGGSTNIHEIQNLLITTSGVAQPTVGKSFNPPSITATGTSTLVINFNSTNSVATTLTGIFTDNLPTGLVVANPPQVGGNCPGTVGAVPGSGSVTYALGAGIPAVGCAISVGVTSSTPGTYTNSIPIGRLQTQNGINGVAATATLVVTPFVAPTVSKTFSPTSILAGGTSSLQITLANTNPTAATLSSALVDTLPGALRVATPPVVSGTCNTASFTATAGSPTVTYAAGASIPPGGCTLSVNVSTTATATYTNVIAAGALQTSQGNNATATTATLFVAPAAQLTISKTNSQTSLSAGQTTTYTLAITNNGPSDASGAVVKDVPAAGLSCPTNLVTCAPASNCPASFGNLFTTGTAIPLLPNGAVVSLTVTCSVTATGQ
jgi:uncharacterized repeat protein (TIGR01451 family)